MNSCNHEKCIVVYNGDVCPVCEMQARINHLESQNNGLLETIQDYKNYLIFGNKEEIKDEQRTNSIFEPIEGTGR